MTLSNVMELHRRSGGRSRNFRTGKGGGAGVVAFVGERGGWVGLGSAFHIG